MIIDFVRAMSATNIKKKSYRPDKRYSLLTINIGKINIHMTETRIRIMSLVLHVGPQLLWITFYKNFFKKKKI